VAWVVLILLQNGWDGKTLHPAKSMSLGTRFLSIIGLKHITTEIFTHLRMKQLTLNFQNDSEATGGMMTSSSQVASRNHANRTPLQGKEKERKMNAIYGQKCCEQLEKFSHVGLWAKMFLELLIGQEDWCSKRYKLIWKLKGTKSSRLFCRLHLLERDIKETGYGLLPTPNANDWNTGAKPITYKKRMERHIKKGVTLQKTLKQLAADLSEVGESTKKLKTSFAMDLMGFPENWTVLPFLNGEKNQSGQQEMP
jgi:hypothetical protein